MSDKRKDLIGRIALAKKKFPSMRVNSIGALVIDIKEARSTKQFQEKLKLCSEVVRGS